MQLRNVLILKFLILVTTMPPFSSSSTSPAAIRKSQLKEMLLMSSSDLSFANITSDNRRYYPTTGSAGGTTGFSSPNLFLRGLLGGGQGSGWSDWTAHDDKANSLALLIKNKASLILQLIQIKSSTTLKVLKAMVYLSQLFAGGKVAPYQGGYHNGWGWEGSGSGLSENAGNFVTYDHKSGQWGVSTDNTGSSVGREISNSIEKGLSVPIPLDKYTSFDKYPSSPDNKYPSSIPIQQDKYPNSINDHLRSIDQESSRSPPPPVQEKPKKVPNKKHQTNKSNKTYALTTLTATTHNGYGYGYGSGNEYRHTIDNDNNHNHHQRHNNDDHNMPLFRPMPVSSKSKNNGHGRSSSNDNDRVLVLHRF